MLQGIINQNLHLRQRHLPWFFLKCYRPSAIAFLLNLYVHVQNYGVHYIESHMTRHVTNSAESAEKNRDSA